MFGLLLEKGLAADRFQVELEQNLTKASLHVAQYDHRMYHRQFGLKDVINETSEFESQQEFEGEVAKSC